MTHHGPEIAHANKQILVGNYAVNLRSFRLSTSYEVGHTCVLEPSRLGKPSETLTSNHACIPTVLSDGDGRRGDGSPWSPGSPSGEVFLKNLLVFLPVGNVEYRKLVGTRHVSQKLLHRVRSMVHH